MIFCSSSYASEIGWDTNRIPFYRIESKSKETALLRIKYNWWQCQHYRIVVDSGSDNRVKTSCSSPLGRGLRGPTEPGVKPIPVPEKAEQEHGPPPSLRWLTKLRFEEETKESPRALSFCLWQKRRVIKFLLPWLWTKQIIIVPLRNVLSDLVIETR